MKNKAIIILSLTLLFLMITAVSASEVNSTDTVSTTDNIEVSVCENNTGEVAVSALPNTNSENANNNNEINVEELNETSGIDDELNVSDENPTSNFELEKSNNVSDSVQDKREFLGAANNLIESNDDANTILYGSLMSDEDSILSSTSNELLSENPYVTVTLSSKSRYLYLKIEATSGNNYKWTITSQYGDWETLYYYNEGYEVVSDKSLDVGSSGTFSTNVQSTHFRSYWGSGNYAYSDNVDLPILPEVDTTVSVTNPSVKYNSGTFSVSGTVTANGANINTGTVKVKIGSTTKTASWSGNTWTASGFSSTAYGITTTQEISVSYEGISGQYKASTGTGTLTVSKNKPTISFNAFPTNVVYNGNTYTISGKLNFNNNNINANSATVTLTVGTRTYTANVNNDGTWSKSGISSTDIAPNSGTIKVKYNGNDYYSASDETSGTINIAKNTPVITVNDIVAVTYNGNSYQISGTAKAQQSNNNLNAGSITLTANNGVTLTGTGTTWSDGVWTVHGINSKLLDPGTYTITATYSNTNYNSATGSNLLTVNPMTVTVNVNNNPNFNYNDKNGQTISGILTGGITGKYGGYVNITINDKIVKTNLQVNDDGSWSYTHMNTTEFSPRDSAYTIHVLYSGNLYNAPNTGTGSYKVNKGLVQISIDSGGDIDIGDNKTVKVTVKDYYTKEALNGRDVVLSGTNVPNGSITQKTNINGITTFIIQGLVKQTYNDWKITVNSNDYYGLDWDNVPSFNVQSPLMVNITSVTPFNSTFPNEIIISGYVDEYNLQGNVSLTIGGKNFTGFLIDSHNFTAILIGVKPGVYTNITAKYNPTADEFYYRGVEGTVSVPETGDLKC